jgi:hypothetical protein
MKTRVCVFCGSEDLTREHVFPDWMSKMFVDKKLTATTTIEKEGKPNKVYKSGLFRHKAKIVCGQCNNGWMSKLETDAKPLLSTMLFDLRSAVKLGPEEQKILSFWAQKTVMILNLSTEADYKIPQQSFHDLYKQKSSINEITVRIGWRLPKHGTYGPHLSHFTIGEVTGPERASMEAQIGGKFEIWRAILATGNIVFHINGSTPNVRVEVENVDSRVTPQIFPYEKELIWPLEWPVNALTSVGFDEFSKL